MANKQEEPVEHELTLLNSSNIPTILFPTSTAIPGSTSVSLPQIGRRRAIIPTPN